MKPIHECLNPRLADICRQAIQIEQLQEKLTPLLPENLREPCRVGSFNKGQLHLVVNDAVWASQLRYLLPELRDKLRQTGLYQLLSIKVVIVENPQSLPIRKNLQANPISAESKALIKAESEKCTFEPLKQALLKLSE